MLTADQAKLNNKIQELNLAKTCLIPEFFENLTTLGLDDTYLTPGMRLELQNLINTTIRDTMLQFRIKIAKDRAAKEAKAEKTLAFKAAQELPAVITTKELSAINRKLNTLSLENAKLRQSQGKGQGSAKKPAHRPARNNSGTSPNTSASTGRKQANQKGKPRKNGSKPGSSNARN